MMAPALDTPTACQRKLAIVTLEWQIPGRCLAADSVHIRQC